MSHQLHPVDDFERWLPGELVYSATKAGYDMKIPRAILPIEDPRSMYGFLGTEWFTFQSMRRAGNHHSDEHAKSAQLQLAKFAAGLFDKAGIASWMMSGAEPTTDQFTAHARIVADEVIDIGPLALTSGFGSKTIDRPFEDTPFSEGVRQIMRAIAVSTSEDTPGNERWEILMNLKNRAMFLGGAAAHTYVQYAEADLTPDQYVLADSQLV